MQLPAMAPVADAAAAASRFREKNGFVNCSSGLPSRRRGKHGYGAERTIRLGRTLRTKSDHVLSDPKISDPKKGLGANYRAETSFIVVDRWPLLAKIDSAAAQDASISICFFVARDGKRGRLTPGRITGTLRENKITIISEKIRKI